MKNHTPLKLTIDTREEVLQCCAPVLTGLGGTGSGIETSLKGGAMLAEGRWGE